MPCSMPYQGGAGTRGGIRIGGGVYPTTIVRSSPYTGLSWEPTVGAMTASVVPRPGTRRPGASVPWSPRAWRQALYLAGGIPALMIAPFLLIVDARVDHSQLKALFILGCIFLA